MRARRLHPDAAVALLALAGVSALLLLAHALEPPRVALAEVPDREGARVQVEARVLQVEGRRLVLADATHRIGAFAPAHGPAPARGDLVRAEGIVARLDDGPGLSLDALVVVEPAAARPLLPSDLAARPESHDGARVLVLGEVRGDALVGGDARVRLRGEPPPSQEGDWLARGTFHYREEEAAYVLRVESWTRPS